jgi:hypothetical protein
MDFNRHADRLHGRSDLVFEVKASTQNHPCRSPIDVHDSSASGLENPKLKSVMSVPIPDELWSITCRLIALLGPKK